MGFAALIYIYQEITIYYNKKTACGRRRRKFGATSQGNHRRQKELKDI